jgi:hypothetical protein
MSSLQKRIEEENPNLSAEQLTHVQQIDEYLAANRVH